MSAGPQGPDPDDPTFTRRPRASDPEYVPPPNRPSGERFEREAGEGPGYGERRGSGDRPRHRERPDYEERSEYEGRYEREPRRERGSGAAAARRNLPTPDPRALLATSELAVWAATLVAVVIAGAIGDNFPSWRVWLYVTILSAAYMLSRGLAKAGARRDDTDLR